MNSRIYVSLVMLVGCCFAKSAGAEDYDYELSLSYGAGNSDTVTVSSLNAVPTPSLGIGTISSDSDEIDLSGAWYYSGLSDAEGPKSRAAFLSRASSISLDYSRVDESGSFTFSGGSILPPVSGSTDLSIDMIAAKLRHVWRDSGWYVIADASRAESEFSSVINGNVASGDFDATALALGVGKYFGKATAVDLTITDVETDGFGPTTVALTFTHVGSISKDWQYGADIVLSRSDANGDEGTYYLRGSLYPSPDFEFGIGYSRHQINGGIDLDSVEGFVGWFVRDHVELTASYQEDIDDNFAGQDTDSNVFRVGVSARF